MNLCRLVFKSLVLTCDIVLLGTDAKGKGVLYDGLFDALCKIFRTEGVFGLYKGVFPTWLRIAPHTVLCLVFYEKIARFYGDLEK